VIALLLFAALFGLTMRRGATDPVCHMTVDRAKAKCLTLDGATHYFCSDPCLQTFEAAHAGERTRTSTARATGS
jgi:YHS domain-containing protein